MWEGRGGRWGQVRECASVRTDDVPLCSVQFDDPAAYVWHCNSFSSRAIKSRHSYEKVPNACLRPRFPFAVPSNVVNVDVYTGRCRA